MITIRTSAIIKKGVRSLSSIFLLYVYTALVIVIVFAGDLEYTALFQDDDAFLRTFLQGLIRFVRIRRFRQLVEFLSFGKEPVAHRENRFILQIRIGKFRRIVRSCGLYLNSPERSVCRREMKVGN